MATGAPRGPPGGLPPPPFVGAIPRPAPYVGDGYRIEYDFYSNTLKPMLEREYSKGERRDAPVAAAPVAVAAAPAGLRAQARAAADAAGVPGALTGGVPRTFLNNTNIPDINGRAILNAIKAVIPAGGINDANRNAANTAAKNYWNLHLDAGALPAGGVAGAFDVAEYKTAIVNAIN